MHQLQAGVLGDRKTHRIALKVKAANRPLLEDLSLHDPKPGHPAGELPSS